MTESFERTGEDTWTFTLREGMTFHNGNPVDAEAVVAAVERVREAVDSVGTALEGAQITTTGELVFTITTPEPNAYIPSVLGSPLRTPIFDVAAFDEAGEDVDAQIAAGMFSGPYQVVSLDTQRMVLEAYPGYWGGPPPFDRVEVVVVSDPQARIAAVQNGEVNIALSLPRTPPRSWRATRPPSTASSTWRTAVGSCGLARPGRWRTVTPARPSRSTARSGRWARTACGPATASGSS